jgi:hypothetical protein
MPQPELVSQSVQQISEFILRYAVTLAAIGALAMALLEAAKALMSVRDRFHKNIVRGWVERARTSAPLIAELGLTTRTDEQFHRLVYAQLIRLTTGEDVGDEAAKAMAASVEGVPWDVSAKNALFALELDRMMGQIQDAADTALSNPALYPDLYLFLAAGAGTEDIRNWYAWAGTPAAQTSEDRQLAKRQADTYARVRQLIRRRLDAFQLTAAYRWQTLNQFASVTLGAVLLFLSLLWQRPANASVWVLIPASVLGGFLAPVAKDLVIALKRVRSGG